jgi:hypothetical protein
MGYAFQAVTLSSVEGHAVACEIFPLWDNISPRTMLPRLQAKAGRDGAPFSINLLGLIAITPLPLTSVTAL